MTDINLLKKSLSRRGQRPALDQDGKPFLTRGANQSGVVFISAEQLVDELAKAGKSIHHESLVISEGVAPTPSEPPAHVPTPVPTTAPPVQEKPTKVWTLEELKELAWNDLRKLAKMWPDVHGNKGKDHILEKMTGKPKTPPQQ